MTLFETRTELRAIAISERMIQYSRGKTVVLDQLQCLSKGPGHRDARACALECLCEIHCNSSSSSTMRTKLSVRILPMTNPPLTKDRRFQIDRCPVGVFKRRAPQRSERGRRRIAGEVVSTKPLNKRTASGRVPAQGTPSEQDRSKQRRSRISHGKSTRNACARAHGFRSLGDAWSAGLRRRV